MENIMLYQKQCIHNAELQISIFQHRNTTEIHLIVHPDSAQSFQDQLRQINTSIWAYYNDLDAPFKTAVFTRYFVSDIMNQEEGFHTVNKGDDFALGLRSLIQQPPLNGNKISAWTYIICDAKTPFEWVQNSAANTFALKKGPYLHIWNLNITPKNSDENSCEQTRSCLEQLESLTSGYQANIRDNCLRTWIYVRDIDHNYSGVVNAGKSYFNSIGLTQDTHYIASTGIEGKTYAPGNTVAMDAYSVSGISPSQVSHLSAPDYLNPTYEYGVTFERGTALHFGDRKHVYISGTASINNKGEILYPNDTLKQCERTAENISALLAKAGAAFKHIAQMIVYIRDPSDYSTVQTFVDQVFPGVPKLVTLAPVCRPGWLVEMECLAVTEDTRDTIAPF